MKSAGQVNNCFTVASQFPHIAKKTLAASKVLNYYQIYHIYIQINVYINMQVYTYFIYTHTFFFNRKGNMIVISIRQPKKSSRSPLQIQWLEECFPFGAWSFLRDELLNPPFFKWSSCGNHDTLLGGSETKLCKKLAKDFQVRKTLPKTSSSPLKNRWLEDDPPFLGGPLAYFEGHLLLVSGRVF